MSKQINKSQNPPKVYHKIAILIRLIPVQLIIFFKFFKNIARLKKAKFIYINSEQFGHSVQDSFAFIYVNRPRSIVISLGTKFPYSTKAERNPYWDKCLGDNLISIYFPRFIISQKVWNYSYPLVKKNIELLLIFLRNTASTVYFHSTEFSHEVSVKIITNQLNITTENAKKIVSHLDVRFYTGRGFYYPLGYIYFLMQNSSINTDSVYKGLSRHLRSLIENLLANKQIVCLAVRRGENLWHSNADYYLKAIDAIYSEGFSVVLIGDRKYLLELAKERNYSLEDKIANYNVTVKEQKALELFAIQKCLFVVGDQGGIWSIVSVFNKPGLLINATPTGQLQYNVESLPRRWVCASTRVEMTDVNKIFGDLFFKWTSNSKISKTPESQTIKNSDSEAISNLICIENDTDFVISVIKRYMKNYVYQSPNEMQDIVKINFPENNFFKLAKKSSYSEEYINQLTGWKIT